MYLPILYPYAGQGGLRWFKKGTGVSVQRRCKKPNHSKAGDGTSKRIAHALGASSFAAAIGLALSNPFPIAMAQDADPSWESEARDTRHHPEDLPGLVSRRHAQVGGRTQESRVGYTLSRCDESRWALLAGDLDLGVTRSLADFLDNHPGVSGIVLDSPGGHVYEGRGLSFLIHARGLETYVGNECSSSCVTAFIGGRQRHMGSFARIGFHRYRLEGPASRFYSTLYSPEAEQRKDFALYESIGVSHDFLRWILTVPSTDIRYPSGSALVEAGIVTRIWPREPESPDHPDCGP